MFNHDLHGVPHLHGTLPEVVVKGTSRIGGFAAAGSSGIGGFAAAGFNIDKFINTLNRNAHERSIHLCGGYMGVGLQAGGIKGAMANGKDYGPILLKNGFNVVSTSGYSPLKGDVTVYDGNKTHKWGHVQAYNRCELQISTSALNNFGAYREERGKVTVYKTAPAEVNR